MQLVSRNLIPFDGDRTGTQESRLGTGPLNFAKRPSAGSACFSSEPLIQDVTDQAIFGGGGDLGEALLAASGTLRPTGAGGQAEAGRTIQRCGAGVDHVQADAGGTAVFGAVDDATPGVSQEGMAPAPEYDYGSQPQHNPDNQHNKLRNSLSTMQAISQVIDFKEGKSVKWRTWRLRDTGADAAKLRTIARWATYIYWGTSNFSMTRHALWTISLVFVGVAAGAYSEYDTAVRKFTDIEAGKLRPGTRVTLSAGELTAYAAHQAPPGVRDAQVRLVAPGVATGTAMVDFTRLQRAQGYEPGWLMSHFFSGERPVAVTVRIRSGAGQATVDVQRVEVAGVVVDGSTLDFLIRNFLLPMYPDAAVGRPFELGNRIEKLDVQPAAVGVVIGR